MPLERDDAIPGEDYTALSPQSGPRQPFAHSIPGQPRANWEPLSHHVRQVASLAEGFAETFGFGRHAALAAQLHDIGKASDGFQRFILGLAGDRGPDHSTAGAREAMRLAPKPFDIMLAAGIAGHHSGLPDGERLRLRLAQDYQIEAYDGWRDHVGSLPEAALMRPPDGFRSSAWQGFSQAFLTRMLFSCLVDADYLATEAFYDQAGGGVCPPRGDFASIVQLEQRLDRYMRDFRTQASGSVGALRAEVLASAKAKAVLAPGLFTLTVPTGGGKTLSSLSFALEHARRHNLRRVVYVIPYTSIIEQTAAVFRAALATEGDVLEHHASFDWDPPTGARRDEAEEGNSLARLRRAAENWDAPIVVTTAVQFFESLFANRPSRCRKLHNLARSVIVLDEAQTLPLHLLHPCVAALDELARNYTASVVLCTATQPALRAQDGFPKGLEISEARELAPDPRRLYAALKRVQVEVRPGPTPDAVVAERFAQVTQMLCIVNSRAHARRLYDAIRELPGAVHLSTLMCPKHRQQVLAEVRERLARGEPVRLVSTSLIEAGVDIDLPEVWRAATGLDSIAQAAGRCNRHGLLPNGRVVVFTPEEDKPPRGLVALRQAAAAVLRQHGDDPLGLDAVLAYFRQVYWVKGTDALDAVQVATYRGVLPALAEHARVGDFPFRTIAEAFRLIDEEMQPVLVPWDDEAKRLLARLWRMERPASTVLRQLQRYVVTVPPRDRDEWLKRGALRPVHAAMGEALLAFVDASLYRPETGLALGAPVWRAPECNLW